MAIKVSLDELIKNGAHFGHQSKRWNPKMEPYLYGQKDGVHLFDLEKTKECLEDALSQIEKTASKGGKILMLGTKKQAKLLIEKTAKESGCYYINERWLGGIFTNFNQIRKSTEKLTDMKEKMSSGFYSTYTKKERLLMEREIQRLERFFGGIVGMTDIPDMIIVIDVKKEFGAVREAVIKGVTSIGIVDSNSDPMSVDYPIPMNDDATNALEYVFDLFGQAIKEGKENQKSKSNDIKSESKKAENSN